MIEKVKELLNKKDVDYFEALSLYENLPTFKNNLYINFQRNYNKGATRRRIVYELEKFANVDYSNRMASVKKGQKPKQNIKIETPEKFEYSIPLTDMPDVMQDLVRQKGQKYNILDKKKRQLADLGTSNQSGVIKKRKKLANDISDLAKEIGQIHEYLKAFDETGEIPEDLMPVNENDIIDEPEKSKAELENEIQKLYSNISKWEERSESSKTEKARQKNAEKADKGKSRIAKLKKMIDAKS